MINPEETELPSAEDQVLGTLRRIIRAMDLRSRRMLDEFGLTGPQLSVLQSIARLQPVTSGTLAKDVYLGQPTLTGILDRLVRRGLVRRSRSSRDRRAVVVRLTPAGQVLLSNAPSLLQDSFRRRMGELDVAQRDGIVTSLGTLADMLDAMNRLPSESFEAAPTAPRLPEDSALAFPAETHVEESPQGLDE